MGEPHASNVQAGMRTPVVWSRTAEAGLFLTIFFALMWAGHLLGLPFESFGVLALTVAALLAYYTASFVHHRRRRERWEDARQALSLATDTQSKRKGFHPLKRRLSLPPLAGIREGRPVRAEVEHLSFGRGKISLYLWFVGAGTFRTQIATRTEQHPPDLDIRLERRQALERTDTRLTTHTGSEARTPFEREHHIFTNAQRATQRLLDARAQHTIANLAGFQALRIEPGNVILSFNGIPERDEFATAITLVTELATRIDAGVPPPEPEYEATDQPAANAPVAA